MVIRGIADRHATPDATAALDPAIPKSGTAVPCFDRGWLGQFGQAPPTPAKPGLDDPLKKTGHALA
jgi:hypothetical protein